MPHTQQKRPLSFTAQFGIMIALTAAYFISGKLGLLLAIPPGYATVMWPPSGIALAALYMWGYRFWPAVFIGSALLNISGNVALPIEPADSTFIITGFAIGAGAALQAIVGTWLLRRLIGPNNPLEQLRDTLSLSLIVAPLSCLINSTIGVGALTATQIILASNAVYSWGIWWIGDTIGIIVFSQILILMAQDTRKVSSRRKATVLLPFLTVFIISVLVFFITSSWQKDRFRHAFVDDAHVINSQLQVKLSQYTEELYSIRSFFFASETVKEDEFIQFTHDPLKRFPGLLALSWAPRILQTERDNYETWMQNQGYPDFEILDLQDDNTLTRAKTKEVYYPAQYIVSNNTGIENNNPVGFDLASNSARAAALETAQKTGEATASSPVKLINDTNEDQFGFLLFLPINEDKENGYTGFAVGVFRAKSIVEPILDDWKSRGVYLRIEDITNPDQTALLYEGIPTEMRATSTHKLDVFFAGRKWALTFAQPDTYIIANVQWEPWIALLGGLIFTSFFCTFLLFVTGVSDMTQKQVIERTKELNSQKALLQRAEKIAHVGHWFIDVINDNQLYWSQEIYEIHGVNPDIYIPDIDKAVKAYHPDDRDEVIRSIETAIAQKGSFEFTLRIMRPSGEFRFVRSIGECEIDEDNEVSAIFGVFLDVTDNKRTEEELRKNRKVAEDAAKAKSEFLAKMSHEIRTPLNGLVGFAELLKQTDLDDYQTHCVNQMHASGRILARLVDDVLEFSKFESGKVIIENSSFQLHQIIDVCKELVEPEIKKKNLELVIEIDPTISETLVGDPYRLQQIYLNLLTNAVEFTEEGRVKIKAFAEPIDEQKIELNIEISDTGVGIPEDKHEEIFQSFRQGQQKIKNRTFGGTGLGLAVVKQIVETMKGSIELKSSPGKGSTFKIKTPVERTHLQPDNVPEGDDGNLCETPGFILVVEDIPMNQEVTMAMLVQKGHQVQIAENGLEAVEAVKNGNFDLVLMDIQMPQMNGVEATRIIREELGISHADLPIVALTAHALPEEVKTCFEAGMDDYITKPVDAKDLYRKIDYWLNDLDMDPFAAAAAVQDKQVQSKELPLVDEIQLYTFIGFIGQDKVGEIYDEFKTDMNEKMANMAEEGAPAETVAKELHAIASMAGNLGMSSLSALCREQMAAIKDDSEINLEECVKEFAVLYEASMMAFEKHLIELENGDATA